ncbi:hypothetical protein C1E24_14970 [Pseudoalteromonas phenolica]|uniref:Uncharacterized protein n=1 Tax=Pseudoalteromonas phenolica TaxID=161398 RepID=A0A5R9Q1D8_9GAMM|nr:hypothetical protein [Pseudoalteromonas phenolica]TLX46069.1 hypothetical protein C1E24_14970 [Pseudoalteromonas phenolica]
MLLKTLNNKYVYRFVEEYREIDFDNIQVCELDVQAFSRAVAQLVTFDNTNGFELVVLNEFGQLQKISLIDIAHDYSGKGMLSLRSLYEAQEEVKSNCLVITYLFPEIKKSQLKNATPKSPSEKKLKLVQQDALAVVDLLQYICEVDMNDEFEELAAWLTLSSYFHEPVLFGAKRRELVYPGQYHLQLSTQLISIFNKASCKIGGLYQGTDFSKPYARISESNNFLRVLMAELPTNLEETIIELYLEELKLEEIIEQLPQRAETSLRTQHTTQFHLKNLHSYQVMRVLHRFCEFPFG